MIVTKDVIDTWLLEKRVACYPGHEQFMAAARHIAALHDLSGYDAAQLTARMLPDGDVQVDTPAPKPGMMYIIEPAPKPEPVSVSASDAGFCGFILGVIVTELVWIISC